MKKNKGNRISKIFYGSLLVLLTTCFILVIIYPGRIYPGQDEDSSLLASKITGICGNAQSGVNCYPREFRAVANDNSLEKTMQVLEIAQKLDPKAKSCHRIAHEIAVTAVRKDPENWNKLFLKLDPAACSKGFFHGIIEGHMSSDPDFTLDGLSIKNFCDSVTGSYDEKMPENKAVFDVYRNCVHSFGHIVLLQERGDVKRAIEVCSNSGEKVRFQCDLGVFMENIQRRNLVAHTMINRLPMNINTYEDQKKLCKSYAQVDEFTACWQNQAFVILEVFDYSQNELYNRCFEIADKNAGAKCYLWGISLLANALETKYIDNNTNKLENLCALTQNDDLLAGQCIKWITAYLLSNDLGLKDRLTSFCNAQPADLKPLCFDEIERNSKNIKEGTNIIQSGFSGETTPEIRD